jgi:hypothetical protein
MSAFFTPREIVSELDRYIVGQNDAKRAVAIALRNRWRRQQLPEAGSLDQTTAATAKIFIDDDDARETQLSGAIGQGVLPLLAFAMGADLLRGGLAHIDVGGTLQMLRQKWVVHEHPSFPGFEPRRLGRAGSVAGAG